jgi:hypothetical protein
VASGGVTKRVPSAGEQARLQGDVFVLDEVVEDGEAVHAAETGLLEAALLGAVVDLGPVVDPHRASIQCLSDPLPEPVFGQIKQARGFRQFLLRGFEKVRAEWAIVCTVR